MSICTPTMTEEAWLLQEELAWDSATESLMFRRTGHGAMDRGSANP